MAAVKKSSFSVAKLFHLICSIEPKRKVESAESFCQH